MSRIEHLTERVAAGDRDAEQALFELLRPGMLFVLRNGYFPRDFDAEDVAHDALEVVLERLRSGSIGSPRSIYAYAAQTARNIALGARRVRRRHRTIADTGAVNESLLVGPDETENLHEEDLARAVLRLLDELPQTRDKLLLVRFYLEDRTKEAICAELGLTDDHFRRVMSRARDRFRELLLRKAGALGLEPLAAVLFVPFLKEFVLWVRHFPLS